MRYYKRLVVPMVICIVPLLHGCGGSSSSSDNAGTSDSAASTGTTTTTTTDNGASTKTSSSTESGSSGGANNSTGAAAFDKDKVPPTDTLKSMTKETLLDFNSAVKTKDFTTFRSHTAKLWQDQISTEKMAATFKPFIDKEVDLSGAVNELEPVFEPAPAIDSQGRLIVSGYYPTKLSRFTFTDKYYPEDNAWKLVGIEVHVKSNSETGGEDKSGSAPAAKSE